MNVIGEIGNFIVKYQEPIQAIAILILVVLVIVFVAKLCINVRKKREILSQINNTVTEINTTVNHLNEKKTEVIYIDSRVSRSVPEVEVKEKEKEAQVIQEELAEEPVEVVPEEQEEEMQAEESTEETEPSLKYFSRDCAVSKSGKKFTLEELNEQIKD